MTAEIFDTVEELTGKYPTFTDLQNAVHAIITKNHYYSHPLFNWNMVATQLVLDNVDYIAKSYAYNRPILIEGHHLRLNPHFQR